MNHSALTKGLVAAAILAAGVLGSSVGADAAKGKPYPCTEAQLHWDASAAEVLVPESDDPYSAHYTYRVQIMGFRKIGELNGDADPLNDVYVLSGCL